MCKNHSNGKTQSHIRIILDSLQKLSDLEKSNKNYFISLSADCSAYSVIGIGC
jgi:flagellar hook protein FlgE